jgi:SP family arabinose:H+ symporter-like MFS transporter
MKATTYLLRSSIVGALGGLLFGFDTAVIAGTTKQLSSIFHLTDFTLGVTVFIGLFGTVLGALTSGELGQKLGGREALRIMAVLYLISAIGCGLAWSWPALLIFRFIGGVGIGGSSVLGPVYIAELAPAKWRGRLVGLFQINIVVGILLAYLTNYGIAAIGLHGTEWRWQLGIAAFPSVMFLILLYTIPRSSRWLLTSGRVDEARAVLQMMGAPDSETELQEIQDSIRMETGQTSEPLFQRKLRLPLFLAISIGLFNQLSGINAILYYQNLIFEKAGYSAMSGYRQAAIVGAMNLAATFLGMALIDRLGRKTLLLIGSAGMAACLAGVATVFFTNSHQALLLYLLIVYIAFFAISQGAVIWVFIAEVFPNRVRSKGQSLGSGSHWVMNAIIALIFPLLAKSSGGIPFAFFASMMVLQFFVVLLVYPETKGLTLEQLQKKLQQP